MARSMLVGMAVRMVMIVVRVIMVVVVRHGARSSQYS